MEMEFKDPGRRRRVFLVLIGAVLAAAAGIGAFTLASHGSSTAQQTPMTSVLVATHDIAGRATISADDVAVRQVVATSALAEAYTDPNQVVGRVVSVPVLSGEQVTPNLFATADANSDFSILGPGETISPDSPVWRAVSLEVPPERAVDGEIQSGDHVDVIISVEIDIYVPGTDGTYTKVDTANAQGLETGTSTKITLQDIEVLKVDADNNIYVLKVDLNQAEQLAHVIQEAPDSFALALRPGDDTRTVNPDYYGVTTDRLVAQYLFPIPQLGDLNALLPYPLPTGAPVPSAPPPTPLPSFPTGSPGPSDTSTPAASGSPAP